LFIQHHYDFGVVEADFTSTGVKVYFVAPPARDLIFSGTVKHIGADVFIHVTQGPNSGTTLAGIYVQEANEVVEYMELAVGGANAALPTNFSTAMKKPNQELVLAKCASSSCKF
jgi:hypothetical protein